MAGDRYKIAHFCRRCSGEVSKMELYGSFNVCPHCGLGPQHTPPDSFATNEPYKLVRVGPWWKFWSQARFKRVFKWQSLATRRLGLATEEAAD